MRRVIFTAVVAIFAIYCEAAYAQNSDSRTGTSNLFPRLPGIRACVYSCWY